MLRSAQPYPRVPDGYEMRCPDHPTGRLAEGITGSGQRKTWCLVEGCNNLAQWLPPLEDA